MIFELAQDKTLIDCAATRHVGPNEKTTDLDFYLRFDSVGWIQVRGAADGRGIRVNPRVEPEAYDMGESGSVITQSIEARPALSRLVPPTQWTPRRHSLTRTVEAWCSCNETLRTWLRRSC